MLIIKLHHLKDKMHIAGKLNIGQWQNKGILVISV